MIWTVVLLFKYTTVLRFHGCRTCMYTGLGCFTLFRQECVDIYHLNRNIFYPLQCYKNNFLTLSLENKQPGKHIVISFLILAIWKGRYCAVTALCQHKYGIDFINVYIRSHNLLMCNYSNSFRRQPTEIQGLCCCFRYD